MFPERESMLTEKKDGRGTGIFRRKERAFKEGGIIRQKGSGTTFL